MNSIIIILNANFDFDVCVAIDVAKRALPGKVMQGQDVNRRRQTDRLGDSYILAQQCLRGGV